MQDQRIEGESIEDQRSIDATKVTLRDADVRCVGKEVGLDKKAGFELLVASIYGARWSQDEPFYSQLHGSYSGALREDGLRPFLSNNVIDNRRIDHILYLHMYMCKGCSCDV